MTVASAKLSTERKKGATRTVNNDKRRSASGGSLIILLWARKAQTDTDLVKDIEPNHVRGN